MASEPYDAKERCCGWCYGLGTLLKCAKCPRLYCSRECQVKDWKAGHHKIWCGRVGEKGIDYDIREAGDKGLGLFAKRDFQRGEKILVERSVMTRPGTGRSINTDSLKNETILKATMALAPLDSSSLNKKFMVNNVNLGSEDEDAGSGLFLNFSRINHDCVGNSQHFFDPKLGLKLLVANHDIPAGSEVTFSYVSRSDSDERSFRLGLRGFQCACNACHSPEIAAKLDRILELDKKIMELGSSGRTEQAIRTGTALLKLYDELQASDMLYARTYYDLFQVSIPRNKTVKKGSEFIKNAYKHALNFYGREEHEAVRKYRQYAENISLHRNYRCLG